MRANAKSSGLSDRPADARAITIKAAHTSTVMTAAPMPMLRGERRAKNRTDEAAKGIPRLSRLRPAALASPG